MMGRRRSMVVDEEFADLTEMKRQDQLSVGWLLLQDCSREKEEEECREE
jgi:hypothetical protein